jgi:1,4-dihydroxy-2-naphthoyl-CoA hydrolase
MTREDFGIEGPVAARIDEAVANQDVIFKDTFPGNLGVHITSAGPGVAAGTLEVNERVRHPGGHAHGGAIAGFGDTLAAWATFPSLEPDEVFSTIEFKANFIRTTAGGTLYGEATTIHRGGRTQVVEVKIYTAVDREKLAAIMMVTQAILKAKPSERASDY